MHPIERLRYVARSSGGDQRMLVRETAGALRGLGFDPAGLVVACRRIVERHPNSGPLWWLCASVLAAPDPYRCAAALADDIEMTPRPTCSSTRCPTTPRSASSVGPTSIGEALLRRGDATVLAIDTDDDGMGSGSFVRRLHRADVDAEIVPASGARRGRAGQRSRGGRGDGVVGHRAAGHPRIASPRVGRLLRRGAGVGCRRTRSCLPAALFEAMGQSSVDRRAAVGERGRGVPLELTNWIACAGRRRADRRRRRCTPECPMSYELLRSSAM